MNNKLTRSFRFASAVAFAILVGIPKLPAYATASGCTRIGLLTDITCIDVRGQRLEINKIRANFGKIGNVCNWRYRIGFRDLNGKEYARINGPTNLGCSGGGEYVVEYKSKPYIAKPGRLCASLYEDGIYLDAACISITP